MTTRTQRHVRRHAVDSLAQDQGWVVSRAQLRTLGVDRKAIAAEVAARRWCLLGRHTIAVRTGSPTSLARQWSAVWETCPAAALDGVSALHAVGLTGFNDAVVHVSVPRGHTPRRTPQVKVHHVRIRLDHELNPLGVPRVRPTIAALRAADWASTDRQAALLLVLPVQQRLVHSTELLNHAEEVVLSRRGVFIRTLVRDVADGAHSLGELDFARLCRGYGLPAPSRQVVRRGPRGRIYLDVRWDEIGLVIEIDGIHHGEGLNPVDDSLRQNAIVLGHDRVLRIPLLGLRLQPDRFMAQVVRAHTRH